MLIPFTDLVKRYGIKKGKILHIGAHECEEKEAYDKEGFEAIWVEGNPDIVKSMQLKYPKLKIFEALIADKDGKEMEFIITNNMQSSSILELDEHKKEHPQVREIGRKKLFTKTVDTFLTENHLKPELFEFVNIDIQGAELLALKGAKKILYYANYLYIEVNEKSLYKNCALLPELDTFLLSYGFERVETIMTAHGWGDAFYKKIDIKKFVNNSNAETNGEFDLWNRIRKECKIIFDVGAREDLDYCNSGLTTYLFEPNPKFFNNLKEKLKMKEFKEIDEDTEVKLLNFGLGEREELRRYYENSQSFHFRNISNDSLENSSILKIKKLDDIVKENNIGNIDFMKIDTEGHEYFVLKGGKESLSKIKYIQFEYGGTYPDCGKKLEDVYNLLIEAGFNYIYIITPNGLMGQPKPVEHLQYSNYFASRTPL
jgi:FkbM family methyltransferase